MYYLAYHLEKGYISYTGGYTHDRRLARGYETMNQMLNQLERHIDMEELYLEKVE